MIGEKIKKERKSVGMTQKQLAEKTGISLTSICNIENGKQEPRIKNYEKIRHTIEDKFHDILKEKEDQEYSDIQDEIEYVYCSECKHHLEIHYETKPVRYPKNKSIITLHVCNCEHLKGSTSGDYLGMGKRTTRPCGVVNKNNDCKFLEVN